MPRCAVSVGLRWSDIDQFGHVNNAAMFVLLEEARARVFGADDVGRALLRSGVVVAAQSLTYHAPLIYRTAPVEVRMRVSHVGSTSFELTSAVLDSADHERFASGVVSLVSVDLGSMRPKVLLSSEVEWLDRLRDRD